MAGGLAGRVEMAGMQGASRDGASGGVASRATCGDGESVREGKTRGSAVKSTLPELGDPAASALDGVEARGGARCWVGSRRSSGGQVALQSMGWTPIHGGKMAAAAEQSPARWEVEEED